MNTVKKVGQRGFTLIELLVVIAIIGILSSVILASLATARAKGRVAAAQETMHSIQAAAASCLNDGLAATAPTMVTASGNNGGGGVLCAGNTAVYTSLPSGWMYCGSAAPAAGAGTAPGATTPACNNSALTVQGATAPASQFMSTAGVSFQISAYSNADLKMITCQESGCTVQTAL